jgi:hypothetical protein
VCTPVRAAVREGAADRAGWLLRNVERSELGLGRVHPLPYERQTARLGTCSAVAHPAIYQALRLPGLSAVDWRMLPVCAPDVPHTATRGARPDR